MIDPAARDRRLEELLHKYHSSRTNRVLVFALYKKEAARLETALQRRGWKVGLLACMMADCQLRAGCHTRGCTGSQWYCYPMVAWRFCKYAPLTVRLYVGFSL